MAFITRKKVGNKKYLQVVENYRQDGKHRQRVLRHIGPYASLEHALVDWQYQAENLSWAWDIPLADRQRNMEHHAQKVDNLRHFLASHKIEADEAELERLRDMLPGRRESENQERISVG
jgi:hypothetical protein